jgi:hypothetical protein
MALPSRYVPEPVVLNGEPALPADTTIWQRPPSPNGSGPDPH